MSFDTGVPNIRVVIREAVDETLTVDVPNISVNIQPNSQYSVNVVPNTVVSLRTGSFNTYADFAGFAYSASVVTVETASYASNSDKLNGKDASVFATTGSNTFIGNQIITGSIASDQFKLSAGTVSVVFTGSVSQGIFGVSEYLKPYISTTDFSGMTVEYMAQRPGACRMGIIMATWLNTGSITFTDISTADIGDTSDISFMFLSSSNELRLRVNSNGSGTGAWTVQSLYKLFPNLN